MTHIHIWIDTQHNLLAQGLSELLRGAGLIMQPERSGANVCVHDTAFSPARALEPPAMPTLALVPDLISDTDLLELLRVGYRGYVRSGADMDVLVRGTLAVAHGELWVEPRVLMASLSPHGEHQLTGRERQVLYYLRRGWTNQAIASQLAITQATVKTHVSAVLNKHGVRHRTDLMFGVA